MPNICLYVVIRGFDAERSVLQMTEHNGLIRLIGHGYEPRTFLVLEYLSEGILSEMLMENQLKTKLGRMLFPRMTFPWPKLLERGIEFAEALRYLHENALTDAMIIHRDLKPDNIGFENGSLKLFDLGLSICVRKRNTSTQVYEMSGYTGTPRYMAPEVARNAPYSENADIYSFSIILWQMATDKVPFRKLNRDSFMEEVVENGLRPKMNPSWPKQFQDLLKACWDADQFKRPSCGAIIAILRKLDSEV